MRDLDHSPKTIRELISGHVNCAQEWHKANPQLGALVMHYSATYVRLRSEHDTRMVVVQQSEYFAAQGIYVQSGEWWYDTDLSVLQSGIFDRYSHFKDGSTVLAANSSYHCKPNTGIDRSVPSYVLDDMYCLLADASLVAFQDGSPIE